MIRSLLARRTTGRRRALRTTAATTAVALLVPFGLVASPASANHEGDQKEWCISGSAIYEWSEYRTVGDEPSEAEQQEQQQIAERKAQEACASQGYEVDHVWSSLDLGRSGWTDYGKGWWYVTYYAHRGDPIPMIDAIMGGGTVIGTECVNGKVVELKSEDAVGYGPGQTLYVKASSKTRLRRDNTYNWTDAAGDNNKDKVTFNDVETGAAQGNPHYLSSLTAGKKNEAEFGTSSGGPASVPTGQGEYQMQFVSAQGGTVILGTMYTATETAGYPVEWRCTAPGTVEPETPEIRDVAPLDKGARLVLAPDDDQDIADYVVQLSRPDTTTEFQIPNADGGTGTLEIEERNSEGTVLVFRGEGITNNVGWEVKVAASNGAGSSDFSGAMAFTPTSNQEPQLRDSGVIWVNTFDRDGEIKSQINVSGQGVGTCKNGAAQEDDDDRVWCVVGHGYEAGSPTSTFQLETNGNVKDAPKVEVGIGDNRETVPEVQANEEFQCPTSANGKDWCYRFDEYADNLAGEQYLFANDEPFGVWDFGGQVEDTIWGDPLDGYEWDDYHVLFYREGVSRAVDDQGFFKVCDNPSLLPTMTWPVIDCQQHGIEVRAIFDWDSSGSELDSRLESVDQFGSRAPRGDEDDRSRTTGGRIRNQLASGVNAFQAFTGVGSDSDAFSNLDTSNLTDMTAMFKGAKRFSADLTDWNVSGLGVGAPVDFDQGTDAWETGRVDNDDRDGTGDGRPRWNTGRVVVSASKVRAERTSDRYLSVPALNAFSIETVKQTGVASSAGQKLNLGYEVGRESVTQEVLEDDASTPLSVGVGEEPRNGRVEVAKSAFPVEVTVTAADAGLIAEGTFEVFAPCKTEPQDVAVTVKQVPSRIRGGVAVEVQLYAGLGVLPPGNVTVRASDGSQTALSVPGGQPSGSVVAEWEWRASGDSRSGTTGDAVSLVFGDAFADFTWSPANTGDDGPECASQRLVVSRSDVTALEMNFESAEIDQCEVGAALLDLLSDLQAPGTPRQSTLTARSLPLMEPAADSDADGVPDAVDQDLDGDGVRNQVDPDVDGDGTPNGADGDVDGDGLSNRADDFPNGPPPVARPMPIGVTDAERDALLQQLYGEQVPVTFPVPGDDYAEGAGQIVVGPDPEIMVEVAIMNLNDQENFSKLCPDLQLPVLPMPGLPGPETGNELPGPETGNELPGPETGNELPGPETGNELPDLDGTVFPILPDGGGKPGSESGSGAGDGSGSGSGGGAGNLRVALAVPSEAFKGVPAELEAEVSPASTDGYVEFAVQEIDLTGQQSVRILGSAPVEKQQVTVDGQTVTVARASLDLVPQDYGDAIVYARVTEKGSGAQDTTARAAVVNPAPFADNFSLTVGGDAWLPVETGNVLGYGYSPVEFTTMTGDAPRITTPVDGPCQVLSTRSIPPQIRMLGTAIAPKRCSFTVTTPGGGAYAPVSYTYDVALSMGTQTATLAAAKAKKTIKKGSMVTVAKKTQTKTDEDYRLKGKKINWSVTSGKDVCSVKTSSSGKVSVKGKKKGTCTVKAKASKVKRKYKSLTEFYNFRVK